MSEQKRVTLRDADRPGPIRNLSMVVRPASGKKRATSHRKAKGVVEQGVENAYRVYEEYMRRGREAAESLGRLAGHSGRGSGNGRDVAGEAVRYWTDMAEMWVSLLSPEGPARGRRRLRSHREEPLDDEGDDRISVKIELLSERPVEVTIRLREEGRGGDLSVHPLHAVRGEESPGIRGARFDREGGRLRLHLHVPADLAAGAYVGPIVDKRSREAVGTLRVVIQAS